MMDRLGLWMLTVLNRMRGADRDAGAGFVEYAGILIIVAAIFVAIDQLGLDGRISSAISDTVDRVIGGGG